MDYEEPSSPTSPRKIALPKIKGWNNELADMWQCIQEKYPRNENLPRLIKLAKRNEELLSVELKEANGCTLFLAALNLDKDHIAFGLQSEFPYIIKQSSNSEEFYGLTALHISILMKKPDLAKKIVEMEPSLIEMRCTGTAFEPSQDQGYGELPLFCAIAMGDNTSVEMLLDNGADVFATDSKGNNALHFTVYHKNPKMYDYLVERMDTAGPDRYGTDWSRIRWACHHRVNEDGLSAMNLPCTFGRGLEAFTDLYMWEYIMKKHTKRLWSYKIMCSDYVPLDGFDYIHPETNQILQETFKCQAKPLTTIEAMVKYSAEEASDLQVMQEILDAKWEQGWKKAFTVRAIGYLAFFISFNLYLAWPNFFTWTIVLILTTLKAIREYGEMKEGFMEYWTAPWVALIDNVAADTFIALVYFSTLLKLFNIFHGLDLFVTSCASVLLWLYSFIFFLTFQSTGSLVVMVATMIAQDVSRYILLYSLPFGALTVSLKLLHSNASWGDCAIVTVGTSLGQPDFDFAKDSVWPSFVAAIIISWLLVSTVLMINLLIAMMGTTYSTIADDSTGVWFLLRTGMGLLLEQEMPAIALKGQNYAVTFEGRRYYVLKNPEGKWFTLEENKDD
eukprot:NODE_1306_length_2020_cov_26.033737_g1104_i0.p1 GENE.NODE_1306_length_2020_cov_26.033737_g1104_i0~~NODE_1306_length_2020_cov_26.033737_g1104_i0.p1  ORF type:complete len:617 (-),score=101.21 NODE_1306_length_2020_cov_26.033737_g1104_i0:110-1960(-)